MERVVRFEGAARAMPAIVASAANLVEGIVSAEDGKC